MAARHGREARRGDGSREDDRVRRPRLSRARAGQHLDIRLTAEDGYRAEREYSIASAPGEPVAITVERLDDGEVSPYLTGELRVGDEIELRGPVGSYFVWDPEEHSPLLLVAGGSGIVPLRSMLTHRNNSGSDVPVRVLYSSRTLADVIHRAEFERPAAGTVVIHTLTREQPPGWTGYARRVDSEMLSEVIWPTQEDPNAFVCGHTSFVGDDRKRPRRAGLPDGESQD